MVYFNTLIVLTLILSGCLAEDHLNQAIKHSEASLISEDGKAITKYSLTAISHALSVQDQKYISTTAQIHLSLAIISLEQAIENAYYDEKDLARKAARVAIAHFREIKN